VSRRLPIWRLYERARSLGLAVQVSAQSWEGLAGTQDERQRVAATAEGGIWLLRTPHPEPVMALAGTRPAVDTSRRFAGPGAWGDDGLSRTRLAPVLDGDLVRRLDVGQVCYVYRGGVTFLQIKRLTGRQAAIGPGLGAGLRAAAPGARRAAPGPADPGRAEPPGGPPTVPLPAGGAARGPGAAPAAWPPWQPVGRHAGPTAPGPAPTGPAPTGPALPGPALPGPALPGPALPDVSEVLDEAFGERRE
jgi:hypothetical protein